LRQHADIGKTAWVPIGCPAATAEAYRERPLVMSDSKKVWPGPINIARWVDIILYFISSVKLYALLNLERSHHRQESDKPA